MNHEKIARTIVDEALVIIEKEPEHKFSVAQLAVRSISPVISDLLTHERFSGNNTALKLQKELLEKIEAACL